MAGNNIYDGVGKVVEVSTNIGSGCADCGTWLDGSEKFSESINHYIQQHGYRLLHVGGDTTHGNDGTPWHNTLAVLGK